MNMHVESSTYVIMFTCVCTVCCYGHLKLHQMITSASNVILTLNSLFIIFFNLLLLVYVLDVVKVSLR